MITCGHCDSRNDEGVRTSEPPSDAIVVLPSVKRNQLPSCQLIPSAIHNSRVVSIRPRQPAKTFSSVAIYRLGGSRESTWHGNSDVDSSRALTDGSLLKCDYCPSQCTAASRSYRTDRVRDSHRPRRCWRGSQIFPKLHELPLLTRRADSVTDICCALSLGLSSTSRVGAAATAMISSDTFL